MSFQDKKKWLWVVNVIETRAGFITAVAQRLSHTNTRKIHALFLPFPFIGDENVGIPLLFFLVSVLEPPRRSSRFSWLPEVTEAWRDLQ